MWAPYGPERCTCTEATEAHAAAEEIRIAKEAAERKADEDAKQRARIEKIVGKSGMGERFLRRTFATFQETPENSAALKTAKRFTVSFDNLLPTKGGPEPGKNGLFITGPAGTGKTHLAAAIANDLLGRGTPVICMTMIDLLEKIKSTYSSNKDAGITDEGSVLRVYKSAPLLIIDDVGKEPPTDWAVSTVYNIVNGRYEAYLPTIITTNYDAETLVTRMTPTATRDRTTADATIDRIMEMCRAISLGGESWRRGGRQP